MKIAVIGLGNIGRRLLELIEAKRKLLKNSFNLDIQVVGIADSTGAAISESGFDLNKLIELKKHRGHVSDITSSLLDTLNMAETVKADLLVELSPTDLKTGGVGLQAIHTTVKRKLHVVTANKGPLVLNFQELIEAAKTNNVKFLYSATVTGGLPTLNIGKRDLSICEISKFEGIVNSTTDFILSCMAKGLSFESGLRQAQEDGYAEADPSLDIDGWDAANKLVIIANAVLKRPTKLNEVSVQGIRHITTNDILEAKSRNQVIKLIACAQKSNTDYTFSVQPTFLEKHHPLVQLGNNWQGVLYHTDVNGKILAAIDSLDPYPTAAAVLEDIVELYTHLN